MELRKGYKQTEVGVIPNDWEVVKLGEIAALGRGRVISHREIDASISSLYPVYSSQTLDNGVMGYIDTFDFEGEYLTWTTDGVNAGAVFYRNGKFNCTNVCGTIKLKKHHALFVSYILSTVTRKYVATNLANPKLMNNVTRQILFPLPSRVDEQHAVAAALSDVDALLSALDDIIAKKRLIKQGVMQELLTGKRRLPGFIKQHGYKQTQIGLFPEDWEIVPLKSISSMHGRIGWQGLKQTEFTMNAEDPFLITGMNFKDGEIRWEEVYHVPWARYEIAKEIQLKNGDVLMTKDGTIGKILYVDEIPYPGKTSLNSHLLVFRPLNNRYIPKFLFYQLNSKTFHNHIEQEKSGTTFFGITQVAVGKYNTFLPSVPEQQAIAEILTDMDAEITALEQMREKTHLLKQGMMQELLTGRIRLI